MKRLVIVVAAAAGLPTLFLLAFIAGYATTG